MTWLLWRQHRAQWLAATLVLAALAVPVWITGRHLADALQTCQADNSCGAVDLFRNYNVIADIVSITVLIPLLVGVFWGCTIVGKELENGTAALAWTQTTTRRAWLRGKLLALFGVTLLGSSALAALVTWWSNAHNVLVESRFGGLEFDLQGLAPVGYSLFSAALGLAAGIIWRRVLPAMATTVAAFVGVRMLVELAWRPHFMAPVTRVTGLDAPTIHSNGGWYFGEDALLHGHVVTGAIRLPEACAKAVTRQSSSECLGRLGYQLRETYQPANRYWTFQWIEFGIFVGLTIALMVAALLVLRRRDV